MIETLNITLLNPEAKSLLLDLEQRNLITINNNFVKNFNNKLAFIETVKKIRERTLDVNLEDILDEVENVRKEIYEKENNN